MHHLDFISRALRDNDYRDRLKANPEKVVREAGTDLHGAAIKVVENTADTFHIAMPADPNANIADSALENMSGGGFFDIFKGTKASSAGTALSTVSSADIADTRGKNKSPVINRTGKVNEEGYFTPSNDAPTVTFENYK